MPGGNRSAQAAERGQRDARLNIRMSVEQQQLIRRAASATDRSVTDFVLASATTQAERVLADRRRFVLTDEQWEAFETLLDAPVEPTAVEKPTRKT
ncbi:MAG TPA: DUF1778 domain-containing protein [Acidimicrobiia bacterium]|jgi:uncharacterized protein (DUF1778 family)|nr:DUF1778 domain-containing protein [Acidimicrobiia bacterium]